MLWVKVRVGEERVVGYRVDGRGSRSIIGSGRFIFRELR